MTPLERWVQCSSMKMGAACGAKGTGSKQRGIEYHRRIYRQLATLFSSEPMAELLVEPWYRCVSKPAMRSPDAVVLLPDRCALVVEVKLNWRDGRDRKLLDEYLPIVRAAHKLDVVWPLLITKCLRGYQHPTLFGLEAWEQALSWQPGQHTPVLLAH